jgi:hypothetical protein
MLEDKCNLVINQLHSILNPIPQAPPLTQVESVIQDVGKTIKWNLEPAVKVVHNWMRRKAKKLHVELRDKAKDLLKQQRRKERMERKWEKRKSKRTEKSMVVDSGATSTCIRSIDSTEVEVLNELSPKTFINANGTASRAGNKARLHYNLREPANDADMVPNLAMNSLLSTSKLADASYVTVFTKDEVQVFDTETAPFKIEGKMVVPENQVVEGTAQTKLDEREYRNNATEPRSNEDYVVETRED